LRTAGACQSGTREKSAAALGSAHEALRASRFVLITLPLTAVRLFRQADVPAGSRLFKFKSIVVFFMLILLRITTHAPDNTRRSLFVSKQLLPPE